MTRFTRFILAGIATLAIFSFTFAPATAQTGGGRISFGVDFGLSKYWGDFTDNQFFMGGDIFLRWNIIPEFSLHGVVGLSQLRIKVNEQNILSNPTYFGPLGGGVGTGDYPNTTPAIRREVLNTTRASTYMLMASVNVFPNQKFVPFLFAGAGALNFEPRNKDQNVGLPNNQAQAYDKTVLVVPFGIGVEWYLTDDFVLGAKGQMHLASSDFIDDLAIAGSSNDAFANILVGFSYYIFGSLDCDKDGLLDSEEKRIGTDACSADTDGEGLTDFEEVRTYGTNPLKSDTDDDGLNDFQEVRTYLTDPKNPDTDSDGLKDGNEVARKTDPKNPDTDGDALTDGDEVNTHRTDPLKVDTDGDQLRDGDEIRKHSTNPLKVDTDGDQLGDGEEVNQYKTDPNKVDTDADELADGDEVKRHRTNPTNRDTDNDKCTDGSEVLRTFTDPLNPDSDRDGVVDCDDGCPLIAGVASRKGCPEPPKVGTITNFPAIYYIVDTDQFDFSRPETQENLDKLYAYIQQCPGLGVVIEGHASREGPDNRNQELSDMRSAKIKTWLIERNVDSKKIEATIGYGSRKNAIAEPVPNSAAAKKMDPATLENIRKQNRRMAVKVVRTCD